MQSTGRDFSVAPSPVQVGSPQSGSPPLDPPLSGYVPFRFGTLERSEMIPQSNAVFTASEQTIEIQVPSTGFVYGFDVIYSCITASNAATVVYAEDAPYNAASNIMLGDVSTPIIQADGFSLKLAARYGGWEPFNQASSLDPSVYSSTAGVGAGLGGSFLFHLKIPIATNRRSLLGLVGNQDRGQAYRMQTNLAASANVYTTPPTNPGTVVISRVYESYAVPNAQNDAGVRQQYLPPTYNIIPYITKTVSEALPIGGSSVNHYLRRVGNVIRCLILILRSAGSRTTAEANMPSNIQLKVGNQVIFNESTGARRAKMYDRYGFDAPAGVLVYDFIHDFALTAGNEQGLDWLWTQQITQFQFIITYPAGMGSAANNSLTFVTVDMVVPEGTSPYAG
jgi:hypothetical protein